MIRNIFCLTLLAFTPSVFALLVDISPDDVISVSEIDAPVVIDGRLDDAVWQNLPEYDEFSVTDPDTLVNPVTKRGFVFFTMMKVFISAS